MKAAKEIRQRRREKLLKRGATTILEPNESMPIIKEVPIVDSKQPDTKDFKLL